MNNIPTLIFDIGSYSIKVGLNNEEKPHQIMSAFPEGDTNFPIYQEIKNDSKVDFCIQNGEIVNKERLSHIVETIFEEYFPNPDNSERVVFSNTPYSTTKTINSLLEFAFELLPVHEVLIKPPAFFSLTPYSRATTLCVDIGHDVTHVVPVEDGYVISPGILKTGAAGSAIDLFVTSYRNKNTELHNWGQYCDIREFKQQNIQVAPKSLHAEISGSTNNDSNCGYVFGELLFNPKLFEAAIPEGQQPSERISSLMETDSLQKLIYNSIQLCDMQNKGALWNRIILTGGSSQINGLKERLQFELEKLCPSGATPKVTIEKEPTYACWNGAKIYAQYSEPDRWFTRDQYNEDPSGSHQKFIQYGSLHY